jgi:hypothetical protein
MVSSTGMFIAAPLSGVVHTGAVAAWTTWPAAFLSYNFTGLVLPPLNTLIVVPTCGRCR